MKHTLCILFCTMLSFPVASHASEDLESYIPRTGVPEFLFNNFDITTIRSSFGPRRSVSDRTFSSLSPPPTTITDDTIEILEDDWVRRLTIVDRGDFNSDGIEDLAVCFHDSAIGATYRSTQLLLVTRYADESLAIALNYRISPAVIERGCHAPP